MNGSNVSFDTRDMKKLYKALDNLGGKTMQKCVNRAAGKGATAVGKRIRAKAPKGKTGQLKKGFKRKKERSKIPNKAVYQYAMDSSKNNVFQKPIKNPGALGGAHKYWGYYPNSVEYGFLARAKGGGLEYHRIKRSFSKNDDSFKNTTNKITILGESRHRYRAIEEVEGYKSQKVQGQHFVRRAAEEAAPQASSIIKNELFAQIDKEWLKK